MKSSVDRSKHAATHTHYYTTTTTTHVGGDNQTALSTGETDLAYGKGSYSYIGLSDSFWYQYIVLPNTIVFAEQHPLVVDAMPTRAET
jgi:hypothetical protein